MNKIEKDGKVAVLYSPGYGAGWSTWNSRVAEALCMDARIVGPFLTHGREAAEAAARALFPTIYTGGACQLEVEWVDKGSAFEIEEYDGNESVHIIGSRPYFVA